MKKTADKAAELTMWGFRHLPPVSLQQLLVVTAKDCKVLHSIAYLHTI